MSRGRPSAQSRETESLFLRQQNKRVLCEQYPFIFFTQKGFEGEQVQEPRKTESLSLGKNRQIPTEYCPFFEKLQLHVLYDTNDNSKAFFLYL